MLRSAPAFVPGNMAAKTSPCDLPPKMSELNYPKTATEVVETLSELFEYQGQRDVSEILRSAQSRIEHAYSDDWNHGTEYFTLYLEVPIALFARIEPQLDKLQETIQSKLTRLFGDDRGFILNRIVIGALTSFRPAMNKGSPIRTHEFARLWDPDFVRLFLSHVSTHKVAAANLKRELRYLGISAFIAHEDVEPSLDWQSEIEKALNSMDALAALAYPRLSRQQVDRSRSWNCPRQIGVSDPN